MIKFVEPGSPAHRQGIVAGDTVVAVDENPIADVIDWQWYSADDHITLSILTAEGTARTIELTRDFGVGWGIHFEDRLFDGIRSCRNKCEFCFVAQLPPGLRKTLYVRDDDFRLSFLDGNFISLTNLSESDLSRIIEQRLSPLYISLHAVNQKVRSRLIGCALDNAIVSLLTLTEAGIEAHIQIVLTPQVNDDGVLEETLTWLAERNNILSVGIVPLGYTSHQSRFGSSWEDPSAALSVIEQVRPWQVRMRSEIGIDWIYLADEFYINAGQPLPDATRYDGFPQYENGIGIARYFLDDIAASNKALGEALRAFPPEVRITLVTGTLAAGVVREALSTIDSHSRVRVLEVENCFFGGNVGVTGLLAGRDIEEAIRDDSQSDSPADLYLVPDIIFNSDGLTLDDLTAEDLSAAPPARLRIVTADAAGLLSGLHP